MKEKALVLLLVLNILFFPNASFATSSSSPSNGELSFGFYTDKVFVSSQTIVLNEDLNRCIQEIGNRVAKASDRPDMAYTFRVINDPVINAYSAAGGFIYITTGLLDILENQDELAGIIAHEIAHTNKNHQISFINRTTQNEVAGEITGIVLGAALGALAGAATQSLYAQTAQAPQYNTFAGSPYAQQYVIGEVTNKGRELGSAIGSGMAVAMVEGYGKKQEIEADALAIQYSKKSGYDPNGLPSAFKKLLAIRNKLKIDKTNYVSALINAEPGLEERIKNTEGQVSKVK